MAQGMLSAQSPASMHTPPSTARLSSGPCLQPPHSGNTCFLDAGGVLAWKRVPGRLPRCSLHLGVDHLLLPGLTEMQGLTPQGQVDIPE